MALSGCGDIVLLQCIGSLMTHSGQHKPSYIKHYLAMQSFMKLFRCLNLIFCVRACFLQADHFLRSSSCLMCDFSAARSTKGFGEKTDGVCATEMPLLAAMTIANIANALAQRSIVMAFRPNLKFYHFTNSST